MKKAKKVVALALCAVMLVVGSVAGTMAYLQSSDSVTNTFTVGKVEITLDESKVNEYGVSQGGRNEANTYKLMPGHEYTKDPIVHFAAKSEASYLYVKVENQLAGIESDATDYKNIDAQIKANGWKVLADNVYFKKVDANTSDAAVDYKVFEKFEVKGAVEQTELDTYANKTIVVTAYAVQADGFANENAAWNATFGKTTQTPETPEA